MAHPKVKISDNSGNTVGVTDNRLDVNVAGATIETGDIDVNLDSATDSVEAVLSNTDNAVLDSIDAVLDTIKIDTEAIETAVEILDNAVSGNEMQVDIVTNKHPAGMGNLNSYPQFDVDASPIRLSAFDGINAVETDCVEIIIQSVESNAGYILVGDSGVADATNGIRINAGDTLILPVKNTTDVWLVASAINQYVNVTIIQ